MSKQPILLGVLGGSGLYSMAALEDVEEIDITTPFGDPSSPITVGTLDGHRVAFIARHGRGHHINPSEVNYRANIYAFKMLGITHVLSVSACGSLREDYAPGHIVIPDQLFDFTKDRKRSFFEDGLVVHITVADPFCNDFAGIVSEATKATGATVHDGGTFITIEGPRFSTKAESNLYRTWGMSIIGMTTSPEAFLAREAEMCYAVMAHVTDYDVWHVSEEPVTVDMVIRTLKKNTTAAQDGVRNVVKMLAQRETACPHQDALASALITNPDAIPPETRARLDSLVKKYYD
jgi:5'-methylthioadenosine phosphorylase